MNEGNEMFEISMYAKEWKRNCLGIVWGGEGRGWSGTKREVKISILKIAIKYV